MQFLRVVQAQYPVFHLLGRGEFTQHECHVSSCSLNSTGSIQFGKEANQHAVSLPNTAGLTQGLCAFI
jgi:hypothetical protein